MQRRKEIRNNINQNLYSLRIYDSSYFGKIDLSKEFEKWALTEVKNFDMIPDGMESFILPQGLYAVFSYKGAASNGAETYQYIYGTWIHSSGYQLDNRPHFEILGVKYKNEYTDSEEDIWIPIKKK